MNKNFGYTIHITRKGWLLLKYVANRIEEYEGSTVEEVKRKAGIV